MIAIDPKDGLTLETVIDQVIVDYLLHNDGKRVQTAKVLGIDYKTLYRRLKKIKGLSSGKHNKRLTPTCKANRKVHTRSGKH